MTLLYASTFTDALNRLAAAEQKQVKLSAFDLQMNPRGNGLQMHRIDKAPGFWSVRVSSDIRIILFKDGETTLLAYVDHHDAAYAWAERKRVLPHERTGAMQFVEIPILRAREEEVGLDRSKAPASASAVVRPDPRPFAALTDDQLLDVGVPRDWLEPVREAPESQLFDLLTQLPAEAAEALLDFASGGRLEDHIAAPVSLANPFLHPDAQRRFRMVENLEELRAALDQPFEKWAVFLHPAQRALVERVWSGPARISGSAGTGKTIVALHRAAHLARARRGIAPGRVLLTTFSEPLAAALAAKRDILAEAEPELRERVHVAALDRAALDIYTGQFGAPRIATTREVKAAIAVARADKLGEGFTPEFLFEEWEELVDAWNVADGEAYAKIPRLGRRTRLGASQRDSAWQVFQSVRRQLSAEGLVTWPQIYARLSDWILEDGQHFPYRYVVVDEAQDLSVAQARFLAAVGADGGEAIFFTGDQGQRIFHLPFSWRSLRIDIRGRSHSLKVNYRTSHQIRSAADRLLPSSLTDVDGVEESRKGTVSVFDGPEPILVLSKTEQEEARRVAAFIEECVREGVSPADIAILVRSEAQRVRAEFARHGAELSEAETQSIPIVLMHDAKGLEFRCVAVIACDDDVIPDSSRIAAVGDMGEMESVYESERHLLYVACTRARDRLFISAVAPGSEFLEDFRG